jgi:O-antigen/teichoic acid export membrane protein
VSEDLTVTTGERRQESDRFTFVLLVFGTFGLQGMAVVSGVIAARMLGVEARGQVALVFALGVVCSQLTFGGSLPNAIAKCLAERQVAARDGLAHVVRRWSAAVLLPCVAAAAVLAFLERNQHGTERYGLAVAVFVMTLQTITSRILIGCLQGEVGHLTRMAVVGLVPQTLYTVALAVALLAGWDWNAIGVLAAFFAASALGMAVAVVSLARPTGRAEDRLDEGALWATARQTYVSSVGPVDGLGLDRLLVGALLGTVELGLYAAATAVANLCSIVGNAVSIIVLPRIAMHADDPAGQRAVIRRWLPVSAVIIAGTVGALELVVAPTIRIAFGEEFAGAIGAARWLVLADGLLGFRRILIAILQGQGRGARASWIELGLTPAMVLGTIVASSYSSLEGIGLTMVGVGGLACLLLGESIRRGFDTSRAVPTPAVAPGA